MTSESDLTTIFPVRQTVSAGGEEVEVSPLRLGEIGSLVKLLSGDGLAVLANPGAALIHYPAAATGILSILVRRPADWLSELPMADAADLFRAALEVNADFFTRSGPQLLGAVRAMMAKAGA